MTFILNLFGIDVGAGEPEDGEQRQRQAIPGRRRGFGEARNDAMRYMLFEEKSGVSYDVLDFHDGLIDAFTHYYVNDDEVTLTGDTVDEGEDGRYADGVLRIQTRLGLATETAYADVVAALGADDVWTNDHRGDGVASVAVIAESPDAEEFNELFPGGGQLRISAAGRLRMCFDPREVGQSPTDQSTWTHSDNVVVCWLTFEITDGGYDYATRILPELASWIAAADVCDEDVPLKGGGTEKRYRCGGFYDVGDVAELDDTRKRFIDSCDGWMGETGSGALKVYAGKFQAPTVTLGPAAITAYRVKRYLPDEDAVNVLVPTYTDPAQKFAKVEGEEWRDEADITRRGKERRDGFDLEWVPAFGQARRLCKRRMAKEQAPARGTARTNLYGLQALGERYLTLELPELESLASIVVEVKKAPIDLTGRSLSFEWVQVSADADDWDEDAEEGDPPPVPESVAFVSPDPVEITGFAVAAFVQRGTDGYSAWRARAVFDTPLDPAIRAVRLETREFGAGDDREVTTSHDLEHGKMASGGLAADMVHEARLVPVVRKGRANDATDWETFTTGKAAVEVLVASGSVTAGKVVRSVPGNAGKVAAYDGTIKSHGKLVIGIALNSATNGQDVEVQTAGNVTNASGLTGGNVVYAGADSTPTSTKPSVAGRLWLPLGKALSTTSFRLRIGEPRWIKGA